MAKKSRKSGAKRSQRAQLKILETITPDDALSILRHLAAGNPGMAKRIADTAMELVCGDDLDVDAIADDVQWELESLEVEDVWDRSGSTRHGYVDSGEAAWDMFEEAFQPFREEIQKYKQLSRRREVKLFCMGLLKGLYLFDKESKSEYKDWAGDAPHDFFRRLQKEWEEWNRSQRDLEAMNRFLTQNCPDWA